MPTYHVTQPCATRPPDVTAAPANHLAACDEGSVERILTKVSCVLAKDSTTASWTYGSLPAEEHAKQSIWKLRLMRQCQFQGWVNIGPFGPMSTQAILPPEHSSHFNMKILYYQHSYPIARQNSLMFIMGIPISDKISFVFIAMLLAVRQVFAICVDVHLDERILVTLAITGLILGLRPANALLCNDISHWLGANLDSALNKHVSWDWRHFFEKCGIETKSYC